MVKRPELRREWCLWVLNSPIAVEQEASGRFRFWGEIEEKEGRILRVVTLEDGTTIHNAFFDRDFLRKYRRQLEESSAMKIQYYPETDTLSIELKAGISDRTEEVSDDVTLDFDEMGHILSVDIDFASEKVDLGSIEIAGLLERLAVV